MHRPLAFLLLILSGAAAYSQSYNFNYYSVDKGLSQSEIKCMREDSRGYIWVGTAGGGVCRFNGEEFICYEERDGLAGNIVTSIEEDGLGNMWFGTTWGGVTRFDGISMSNFNSDNGLQTDFITCLMNVKGEQMLVGTNSGLALIEGKSITHFKNRDVDKVIINFMARDADSSIVIVTDRSIVRYKSGQFDKLFDLGKLGVVVPSCFVRDSSNNFWMGTLGNGIFKLRFGRNTVAVDSFRYNRKIRDVKITSLFFDKQQSLWITTSDSGAAWVKKTGEIQHFNKRSGLLLNTIVCGMADDFGNIWFGTTGGGLVKFSSGAFLSYSNYEGFRSNSVFAICCTRDREVWIAVHGQGLYRLKEGKLAQFTEKDGLKSNLIRALFQDSRGRIWIGTGKGVNLYNGGRIESPAIPQLEGLHVRAICEDRNGVLFFGTNGNGLCRYDGRQAELFTEKNSDLSFNYVHSLFCDNKGTVWIGTGNGVNKFQDGKLSNFQLSSGFRNSYIGSITQDKFGNLWFGTDRCLTLFNGGEFRSFTESDGLASDVIYLLSTDNAGNVWVGTNKGLDKLTPSGNGRIRQIINYGPTEGFKGVECNSRAVSRDIEGNLWFGTVNGVFEYIPANDNIEILPPRIHITAVDFHNRELEDEMYRKTNSGFILPEKMKLGYNENHLTFEFDGIQHLSPEKIKYFYRLEGFDKDWTDAKRNRRVSYTNLNPGKYEFKVRAGVNGVFSEPAVFRFTIAPPFWKRWWFVILLGAGFVTAFYMLEKLRRRRNELAKIRLENQVAKRTAEILKQKKEIETLLKEIHHRVKNNLQIINSLLNIQSSYIRDEDSLKIFEECKNRIITMSIIHEKLYESRDLSHLNLKAYLEKLTGFLEKAFNIDRKIVFDITLQDANDIGLDTIIPIGLLVNEIVSNSLKYAFRDREEGRIEIRISKIVENKYELVIGDNGNGFDFEGMKSKNSSFGLELIAILSEQLNGEMSILKRPGTWYSLVFEKIDKSTHKQP